MISKREGNYKPRDKVKTKEEYKRKNPEKKVKLDQNAPPKNPNPQQKQVQNKVNNKIYYFLKNFFLILNKKANNYTK